MVPGIFRARFKLALDNLDYVFGKEKTPEEITGILKSLINELVRNYCELISQYQKKRSGWSDLELSLSHKVMQFLADHALDIEDLKDYLQKIENVLNKYCSKMEYRQEDFLRDLAQIYIEHINYF